MARISGSAEVREEGEGCKAAGPDFKAFLELAATKPASLGFEVAKSL